MGSAVSIHKHKEHPIHHDSGQDEITKRLEVLKKFDSQVQNKILMELDRKMQDLVSHHESEESTRSTESKLPKPRNFDPNKHEARFITSITVNIKKVINVPLLSNPSGSVTLQVSLDENEGMKTIPGTRAEDTNATFEEPVVFTSKELGVENLGTYSKINLLVKRDDEDAAKVTVQMTATSSTVSSYQLDTGGTIFFEVKKGLENFEGTRQRASLRVEMKKKESESQLVGGSVRDGEEGGEEEA
ncbi:hypothetical protein TrCOL_g12798 [Triparma columacea]|uniref:C2 domain-containing protein n=1 Tax=Triparma columacea TaxID=722753 RepID=A0A9W7GAD4_9STRA|nr:hypothetical protein TrCOL_g12798 [Triparma columacea]